MTVQLTLVSNTQISRCRLPAGILNPAGTISLLLDVQRPTSSGEVMLTEDELVKARTELEETRPRSGDKHG